MNIPKDNSKLEKARSLRREMTPHERKLWYLFLRKYPVKIYKQRIIDRYIVDFYCASAKLVIELDGTQHYEEQGSANDVRRTEVLESYGLQVIRYSNREIDREFNAVCEDIHRIIQERKPSPSPYGDTSPIGRGKRLEKCRTTHLALPPGELSRSD